jgi:hypothetical protein
VKNPTKAPPGGAHDGEDQIHHLRLHGLLARITASTMTMPPITHTNSDAIAMRAKSMSHAVIGASH